MGDLPLKTIQIEEMKGRNLNGFSISLKRDGTLMYYTDGVLFSPRKIVRNNRFGHIAKILKDNNFPNCYGEMYIEGKGKNVFDVSRKENWKKAVFMPIDLLDNSKSYFERLEILIRLVGECDSKYITQLVMFENLVGGWDYVVKNDEEGLVLKSDKEWYKIKKLKEAKVEIVRHEAGSEKGTFILANGSRISGTSMDFVKQFNSIIEKNKKPIAEIEFPFITENGHYFQPRLRRIYQQELTIQEIK